MKSAFIFAENEKHGLVGAMLELDRNPYSEYDAFSDTVDDLVASGVAPKRFANFCESRREVTLFDDPYVLMKNCPIDPVVPYLDFDEPVLDKRANKKTFVAEGFLQFYAVLMGQSPIGYINSNGGDVFQDIHPKRDSAETQTQKTLGALPFHNDYANHNVRPDWVNIFGMRNNRENEIFTCFVSNKDLLLALDKDTKDVLRREEFQSKDLPLGEGPKHRILGGATEYDIRFVETNTIGLTDRANAAMNKLTETLHMLKDRVFVDAGMFIGSANNECIHSKEVRKVANPEDMKNRWLMKTVNVSSLDKYEQHIIAGSRCIIAD